MKKNKPVPEVKEHYKGKDWSEQRHNLKEKMELLIKVKRKAEGSCEKRER